MSDWFSYSYIFWYYFIEKNLFFLSIMNSLFFIYKILAYYGIQTKTRTSCNDNIVEMPAKCYYPSVFNQINSTCEYQNSNRKPYFIWF